MDSIKERRKKFLNDLCESLGIDDRSDTRRSRAAQTYIAFGEKRCRTWLEMADGNCHKWEQLAGVRNKGTKVSAEVTAEHKVKGKRISKSARKAAKRQRALAKQAKALERIAGFTKPHRMEGKVNATIRDNEPEKELAILLKQLEKAKNQGDRASQFKQESLKERIAFLRAVLNSPKI